MISRTLAKANILRFANQFSTNNSVDGEEPKKSKSYYMPKEEKIEMFKPSQPLRLHNYRTLLYLNKQRLTTPQLLQLPYATTFFTLIYLIRYNPWYMTFPASLPIMIGTQFFVFFAWIKNKKHFKFIIERVYLYSTNVIEFTFSNKIRRKLKSTEDYHMFNSPDQLKTPSHNPDGTLAWSQKKPAFPEELVYQKNSKTGEIQFVPPSSPIGYGWTKYASNFQPYIFPKNYEYANWQILVPLLSGRYIEVQGSTNQIHDFDNAKQYALIEQELEWIAADKKKDEEAKLALLKSQQIKQ